MDKSQYPWLIYMIVKENITYVSVNNRGKSDYLESPRITSQEREWIGF